MEKPMDSWWEAEEVSEAAMKLMHVGKTSPWGVYGRDLHNPERSGENG